ncbi:uncharacterized protein LOC127799744 [Diospyros lotus]|uniref:uncharacterized protein LOC127799744 n=1 Tax=Diospyros lotus TaxID=55363 RepID=UPI0022514175|nr:uncharacterized protein LOC127799744 [Diospyros lotus]
MTSDDISFTENDFRDVHWLQNDTLVVRARIGNMKVRRVMVDTGSSINVMYKGPFDQMRLGANQLIASLEPLYGLTGDAVILKGRIKLSLIVGESGLQAIAMADFLIIDSPSAYNVIMGRLSMNDLDLVVPTKALAIKFPTPNGTGCVRGEYRGVSHDLDPRDVDYNRAASLTDELEDVAISSHDDERRLQMGKCLSLEVKSQLIDFLKANLDVFAGNHEDMVGIDPNIMQHRLNINPNYKLVRQKRRLMTTERYMALKEEVDKVLASGFISEAHYPTWVANPVLVKKKNGKWRTCIDFTNPKDSFSLPRIDQLVDATYGHQLLSFMDAYLGYNQIPMNPDEEEHTSFMTDRGL